MIYPRRRAIKGQLKELVRGSVEETLNGLLGEEAEELTQAGRYERSEQRQGYRSGHYNRNLMTTAGKVISFARTLVSNPAILILDEATSSIDTKTERLLQQGIAEMLKGRTSFIIAHRLSTIKNCDRILYIGSKGILEQGSHDELMAKKGLYYRLYITQACEQGVDC